MGVYENPLLNLIQKFNYWASFGKTNPSFLSSEIKMATEKSCYNCELKFSELSQKYNCQGCRRLLCGSCVLSSGSLDIVIAKSNGNDDNLEKVIKGCKFCSKVSKRNIEKVYPSESPRASPEPQSPTTRDSMNNTEITKRNEDEFVSQNVEFRDRNSDSHIVDNMRMLSIVGHPSQSSLHHSPFQSDEEPEESERHFFSSTSEYCHTNSDIDAPSSLSFRNESYSLKSTGSSPLDSPSRLSINTPRAGNPVQKTSIESPKPHDTLNTNRKSDDKKILKPLDFENNGHIWFPPPPEDEEDETENNFFEYEDDDDDVLGVSDGVFSSCDRCHDLIGSKESQNEEEREPIKSVIHGHFRALVSQLLQGEGIEVGKENGSHDWLDIVSNLSWQAANFVKPDTRKGGSMDPGDYVKIKCIASGSPNESTLIKGIVCTKNIKHKRMTSQYKTPRLLLLGGSLEYQRAQNQLASFSALLDEEMKHLKVIVSKVEAHRPNVLLVEKSVSSYAQQYLLEKEISLVLNVKKPLLERIARCTGALITPSIDKIPVARLGHCELFRVERVSEEHEISKQSNKRPSKTLMFFEGCPRRLGCTVLLKGLCREELKKIKHVVQYAIFAAYHLSLETSFLADEGAHLPQKTVKPSYSTPPNITLLENATSNLSSSPPQESSETIPLSDESINKTEESQWEVASDLQSTHTRWNGSVSDTPIDSDNYLRRFPDSESFERVYPEEGKLKEGGNVDEKEASNEYPPTSESHQSILVSFSSHCVSKGTLCERSRLLRIRFYGSFDKPLGKYLCDDLFDQVSVCRSCKEPIEAHVQCYTHRQGVLTINVRKLEKVKLPGERDGKIWMWHRCLQCAEIDNVPPATRRVILSDAAWGLSFGKFLELSFSNHTTANRVASCGHSLQRDCLRFYGYGSMVAFFHYSPIDILTVHLPCSVLDFNGESTKEWMKRELEELKSKMESFYAEVSEHLIEMEKKSINSKNGSNSTDLHKHILELKEVLDREKNQYNDFLEQAIEDNLQSFEWCFDILELNQLRRSLLIDSHSWDRRFYSLDSLLNSKTSKLSIPHHDPRELNDVIHDSKSISGQTENEGPTDSSFPEYQTSCSFQTLQDEINGNSESRISDNSSDSLDSPASNLSDKIDSAWTGTDVDASQPSVTLRQPENVPLKKLMAPVRVYSFDSAMRLEEKLHRKMFASSQFSAVRSFHASGDYRNMIKIPASNVTRTLSQVYPHDSQVIPSFISGFHMSEGPRLLLPNAVNSDLVIAVYDDEPTSIISYALSSREYEDWVCDKWGPPEGTFGNKDIHREDSTASTFLSWQSFGSLELDFISYGSYGSEETLSRSNTMVNNDLKRSPHFQISFEDDSLVGGGKVKFSVTCYFAKQFDMLQAKCCPNKLDFVRSLSRCKRWSAQGGKSNVYFAKSLDDRFIIKQVTKTELESFQEFATDYFKYLNDALDSGSPTCLAKVLGTFQVTVKHLKGGRETKMDLMVMENLFFKRNISRIYDLKGSSRSRYNPDTTGSNKVLLDMNLLEILRTNPIFLGSKAKRRLERAVWNDTSFLASIDVMDYSLLVGVDEERKELVLGIIDCMRQYTWDKHLETWVKASGILGGLKNASPTIISPKQYKRRFRKAMTTYFLTVPDQWSS